MEAFFISSLVTGGISALANFMFKSDGKAPTNTDYCCNSTSNFALPDVKGVCPTSTQTYQMVFFSPKNAYTNNPDAVKSTDSSNPPNACTQNVYLDATSTGQAFTIDLYKPLAASKPTIPTISNVLMYTSADGLPLNFSPQAIVSADNTQTRFAGIQLPFPITNNERVNGPNGLYTENTCNQTSKLLIFGPLGSNDNTQAINNPNTGPYTPENATKNAGRITTLYIQAQQDTVIYLELGGAFGGDVPINSGLLDGQGKPIPALIGYNGGRPGVVFGQLSLFSGDILKVFLGSQGQNPTSTSPDSLLGQGGIATTYAGTNGGGSSYAVLYSKNNFAKGINILSQAISNVGGRLLAVAGGGGGASVNASGGSAGYVADFAATSLQYGMPNTSVPYGSQGCQVNAYGDCPVSIGLYENEYSGGGGTLGAGGRSNVTNQFPAKAAWGTGLVPFVSSGGGSAATATDSGSGGGGGGSGLYGGGAGGYNGIVSPNNLHGAGGGGSSFNTLKPLMKSKGNGNVYRAPSGSMTVPGSTSQKDGYMVLGISQV